MKERTIEKMICIENNSYVYLMMPPYRRWY